MNWSPVTSLSQFAPSGDPTTPGFLIDLTNIIPLESGWRSAYGLASTGMESLTATCVGAAYATLLDGTGVSVAGTSTGLFVRSTNSWTNKSGSETYAASEVSRWRFAQMGNNILAATADNLMQVSASGATFTAIAGSPKAALIESVYGFIMAADVNDGGTYIEEDRWWCSALFDHTDWTPSTATQCTTGRLVDTPGAITGLRRLGANIVAYKKNSMYLGEYVEPPTVWDWNLISSNVGCSSHDAIVNIGRAHLFPGSDNFYLFDGATLTPIGEPVRRWFWDTKLLFGSEVLIQSSHDPAKGLVYWFFPEAGGSTQCTKCLVYNYKLDKWGYAAYSVQSSLDYTAGSLTYDGLGDYYSTYDTGIDRTYDSPTWTASKVIPAVIDGNKLLKSIDGASDPSAFTCWYMGDDQQYSLLRRARVRWLTSPTTATMQLSTCDEMACSTFCACGGPVTQTENKFDKLRSARWHKLTFNMTGNCEFTGVQVDIQPQGGW